MSTPEPGPIAARRWRWPLRSYLIGLVVLFVVAAGAGIDAGWVQARHDAVSAARADASMAADLAAREIQEQLDTVRETVGSLASSPGAAQVFADPGTCRLAFSLGGADDGHLDLLRPDGTVVCSSRSWPGAPAANAYAGASWLPGAARTAQAVAPVHDERTGRAAFLVTAVVPGLGLVAAFVDLAALGAAAGRLFEATAAADPAWRALHADLNEIVAAGDRATGLTRQLLSFARADPAPETRSLDLNTVVTDLDTLLRRALGEDITVVTDLTAQPWPILADPGRLEQVLVNLAVNARDAMPGGGTLTIETAPVTVDEHYAAQHPGMRTGRYMRLRVSDTGTGMSRATRERAFEPFFTTKPKGHGTGLGLVTIYGIITQAGGYAQIYSELGHGTTITALLPATDDLAEPDTAPAPSERPSAGGTILLVEDDDSLRAITERILQRAGYTVLSAATAAEAQQLAGAHPGIALLLTDVMLPDMHGPALAAALPAIHAGLPVVYLSGYTETILATRSTIPAGATLLTKPVGAHQLLHTVARALDGTAAPAGRQWA
ncbi:ATP-binding protein [Dactylosporangium sp. McL0621]|uniref:ATP-binding protein n=1 Tax=Dactylosporangium sp. McL0621 TaxID=3415678 RepID=UPI003CEE44F5